MPKGCTVVELNVGGQRITTLASTLSRGGNKLRAYTLGDRRQYDKDKQIFLDANAAIFQRVLDFLRRGRLMKERLTKEVLEDLWHEATVWEIDSLKDYVIGLQSVQNAAIANAAVDMIPESPMTDPLSNSFHRSLNWAPGTPAGNHVLGQHTQRHSKPDLFRATANLQPAAFQYDLCSLQPSDSIWSNS